MAFRPQNHTQYDWATCDLARLRLPALIPREYNFRHFFWTMSAMKLQKKRSKQRTHERLSWVYCATNTAPFFLGSRNELVTPDS